MNIEYTYMYIPKYNIKKLTLQQYIRKSNIIDTSRKLNNSSIIICVTKVDHINVTSFTKSISSDMYIDVIETR